jgi:hypothetical protein
MEENKVEIAISMGKTINLGNYNSAKIEIWIKETCLAKDKEQTYKSLREDLMDKLAVECEIIEKNKKIWPDCE